MYWANAAEWLIRKSKKVGPFKERNIKFLGIHKEKRWFCFKYGN